MASADAAIGIPADGRQRGVAGRDVPDVLRVLLNGAVFVLLWNHVWLKDLSDRSMLAASEDGSLLTQILFLSAGAAMAAAIHRIGVRHLRPLVTRPLVLCALWLGATALLYGGPEPLTDPDDKKDGLLCLFTPNPESVDFDSVTGAVGVVYAEHCFYFAKESDDEVWLPSNQTEADEILYDRNHGSFSDAGDDTIHGRTLADIVHGGSGNDSIEGGSNTDSLLGDGGNDM